MTCLPSHGEQIMQDVSMLENPAIWQSEQAQ
jgi:hypothetical protein